METTFKNKVVAVTRRFIRNWESHGPCFRQKRSQSYRYKLN